MTRSRIEDILPLQPLQEGFLFHSLVADGAVDVYTSQVRFDLAGVVDGAALRRAGSGCWPVMRICGRVFGMRV